MINTDKYGNEKRNWKVRDTFPDGASVDVELGWVYEDIVAVKGNGHRHYTVAQMVDTGGADALLIADAPLLLEEVKQIHEILREAFSTEAKHSGAEYLNMIARITGLIE
jgi:hypothetical protein